MAQLQDPPSKNRDGLSPGQTPEQAARLDSIIEAQGKMGLATIENLIASVGDTPLWETDEEFEQFQEFVRAIRSA